MITTGIAFVNNKGKFALKSLGTCIGGRPTGTLPQTFTCERVRCERQTRRLSPVRGCGVRDRQTDKQTDSQPGKSERQKEREGREEILPPACRVPIAK